MDESEKSGITIREGGKRFTLGPEPSTVTVMDSENIGHGGVETGSTGERDMHSDATSHKHPVASSMEPVPRHEDSSSSASNAALTDHDGHGEEGLFGADSTAPSPPTGHGSDVQSAEGLASDLPERKGIHTPASSGDRATDITGIPYIQ